MFEKRYAEAVKVTVALHLKLLSAFAFPVESSTNES
jgi:hypothetical protein